MFGGTTRVRAVTLCITSNTVLKVLEFKVWHQANDHTEAFPTLSTQYQILMMI